MQTMRVRQPNTQAENGKRQQSWCATMLIVAVQKPLTVRQPNDEKCSPQNRSILGSDPARTMKTQRCKSRLDTGASVLRPHICPPERERRPLRFGWNCGAVRKT